MAIVSINRILTTQDRVVLEWEYDNIINRLALGNIESDSEMTELYQELLDFITGKRLRQEDAKRLSESYKQRQQEAYYKSMYEGFANFSPTENSLPANFRTKTKEDATSLEASTEANLSLTDPGWSARSQVGYERSNSDSLTDFDWKLPVLGSMSLS